MPVFFGGVPNELDAVALSDDTDFEKLNKVRDILSKRLSTLKLQRGQTRDALKYCYVDWLGMYKKFDHNTARHMAAWTAYVEWFEQLSHDAQGLPNRFIGMPHAEHVIYFTNEMKVTMLHVGTNTLFNISCKFIIVYYFIDFIKAAPIGGSSGRYLFYYRLIVIVKFIILIIW